MYVSLLYVLFLSATWKSIMASSNQPILPDESGLIRQVLLETGLWKIVICDICGGFISQVVSYSMVLCNLKIMVNEQILFKTIQWDILSCQKEKNDVSVESGHVIMTNIIHIYLCGNTKLVTPIYNWSVYLHTCQCIVFGFLCIHIFGLQFKLNP